MTGFIYSCRRFYNCELKYGGCVKLVDFGQRKINLSVNNCILAVSEIYHTLLFI